MAPSPSAAARKRRIVHALQVRCLNRPIAALLQRGIVLPGYALLETTGRRSGLPRRTPVGDGRVGDAFWIVAEHGRAAGYVRNLEADPQVRVLVREGRHAVWRSGTAAVLADDDAQARQRWLARTSPARAVNALAVRAMGTELTTVRIDLSAQRTPAR
jgi:deazaflavin-dependent oxidoreductase (nitroreductase family)